MAFEYSAQADYATLVLKESCSGGENPSVVDTVIPQMHKGGLKFLIVQASECGDCSTMFLRQLSQIYRQLKEINGKMCLVHVNDIIRDSIRKNGLDRILICKVSLRGGLMELGLVKAKDFDVAFINPFLNATQKVLKIQCSTEAIPQKPFAKKPTDPLLLGDVSGIIGITSETFSGSLAISFSERFFLRLASRMLNEQVKELTQGIIDLAGELSNIILGQAKLELNELGYKVQQAVPSCVWGKEHKIKHFGGGICIVLPFKADDDIFHVEITSTQYIADKGAPPKGGTPATPPPGMPGGGAPPKPAPA